MSASPRYAVYWAPDTDHPLWKAGCDWLGRDPESAWTALEHRAHVGEPRRYGFHATLKAPMALRDGVGFEDLSDAAERLAASRRSFDMPLLEVTTLRGFIALRPAITVTVDHPLRRLSDACVRDLDTLRRPLSGEELARRLGSMDFDAAERANIDAVGYAFAFDRWQFHMTLSDGFAPADAAKRNTMLDEARRHFAEALRPQLRCTALSLFAEPAPGRPFELVRRLPLAA